MQYGKNNNNNNNKNLQEQWGSKSNRKLKCNKLKTTQATKTNACNIGYNKRKKPRELLNKSTLFYDFFALFESECM